MTTFDEACEAVLADPEGDHTPKTTLAPLTDRESPEADRRADRRFSIVRELIPGDAETVLVVECGVGRLLEQLEPQFDRVTGVDCSAAQLSFATRRVRRAELLEGDVRFLSFGRTFDAAVCFDYVPQLTDDDDRRKFLRALRGVLADGGRLVFDAVAHPRVVDGAAVDVFQSKQYRLERSVDVAPDPSRRGVVVAVDYRVTELDGGRQATVRDHVPVRIDSAEELRALVLDAGFSDVEVTEAYAGRGILLVVARA